MAVIQIKKYVSNLSRKRKVLLAFDLFMIAFTVFRLYIQFGDPALGSYIFQNGPAPYSEAIGIGNARIVMAYQDFPDFEKSLLFLFLIDWPYFLARLIPWLSRK